jgi:hypothetical protein
MGTVTLMDVETGKRLLKTIMKLHRKNHNF